eukprot:gnl/TRDRNA2_/TRDRNA2_27656_c0_seq1.p1 gnl/TRDRNA2_/TRDRNA2_27656_c0~~gnl/TRDRNA2_/TRDRNA2_27656_c0_seq1.p1  ORF type:complete len:182 (+),score=20.89 gnl/TRDRNA2_/TRDRNA2_27656_c0_seq1:83-547(+)
MAAWVFRMADAIGDVRIGFLAWQLLLCLIDLPHHLTYSHEMSRLLGTSLYGIVLLLHMFLLEATWVRTQWWGMVLIAFLESCYGIFVQSRSSLWIAWVRESYGVEFCEFIDFFMWTASKWCCRGMFVLTGTNALLAIMLGCDDADVRNEKKKEA